MIEFVGCALHIGCKFRLRCDHCGRILRGADGKLVEMPTRGELQAHAYDLGWTVRRQRRLLGQFAGLRIEASYYDGIVCPQCAEPADITAPQRRASEHSNQVIQAALAVDEERAEQVLAAEEKSKKQRHPLDKGRLRELYDEGLTDAQIGTQMRVSRSRISCARWGMGLPVHRERENILVDSEVLELYEMKLTDGEIGEPLGVTGSQIAGWRRCHKKPANHPRGYHLRPQEREARIAQAKARLEEMHLAKEAVS